MIAGEKAVVPGGTHGMGSAFVEALLAGGVKVELPVDGGCGQGLAVPGAEAEAAA
ncbi:hypothetical protein ACRS6B_07130 [Nocardia asteroides]